MLAATLASSNATAQWTVVNLGSGQALAVGGYKQAGTSAGNAVTWSGSPTSLVNLGPGQAVATDGAQQVGATAANRPALWSGTAASFVDLTPTDWVYPAYVTGVDGGIQCGNLLHILSSYAGYWTGSAASWTYLTACPFVNSTSVLAVHAGQLVGSGQVGGRQHAFLWTDVSAACLDMHPATLAGSGTSAALAVHAGQQAGWTQADSGLPQHAALWSGSAASWVDLHPIGVEASIVYGISGAYQVGTVTVGSQQRASLWSGTAASWVDLQAFLPANTTSSVATGVWTDAAGVTHISGYANPGGAVLWLSTTAGSVFCSGDGGATACPCGNDAPAGSGTGCRNSLGTGARLTSSGNPSLSADTLVLHGSGMPNSPVLYLQGSTVVQNGLGVAFGDGLLCAGGTILRLKTKLNVAGASLVPEPAQGDAPISVLGAISAPGLRVVQAYYRNVTPFCTASAFNLTNGLEVVWTP
ncbi:MAG: hypothetical protein NTY35_02090 [Planctomycetota bacterium]|nr:hypothetical protein [Planctomycetota bacterium]